MQKCRLCNKEVVFIATNKHEVVKCDLNPIEVYTQMGRKFLAYQKHKCEVQENENDEQ